MDVERRGGRPAQRDGTAEDIDLPHLPLPGSDLCGSEVWG